MYDLHRIAEQQFKNTNWTHSVALPVKKEIETCLGGLGDQFEHCRALSNQTRIGQPDNLEEKNEVTQLKLAALDCVNRILVFNSSG